MSAYENGMVTLDWQGLVLSIDDGLSALLEWRKEEIVGSYIFQSLLVPPYASEFPTILHLMAQGGLLESANEIRTMELRHRQGHTIPLRLSMIVVGKDRDAVFVLQTFPVREVSALINFHSNGSLISCTNAEMIFQYSDSELAQLPVNHLVPLLQPKEGDPQSLVNQWEQHQSHLTGRRKDGSLVALEGVQLTMVTVSSLVIFRATLRKWDDSREALLLVDGSGSVHSVNSVTSEWLQQSPRQLTGANLSELFPTLPPLSPLGKRQRDDSLKVSPLRGQARIDLPKSHMTVEWRYLPLEMSPETRQPSEHKKFQSIRLRRETIAQPPSDAGSKFDGHAKPKAVALPPPGKPPFPKSSPPFPRTRLSPLTRLSLPRGIPVPEMIGNYCLGRTIGEGAYGLVVTAINVVSRQEVAVKILDKDKLSPADVEKAVREGKILKKLRHPNIVRAFDIIDTPHKLFIFMEYVTGCDLREYTITRPCSRAAVKDLFRQLTSALHYCHSRHVIHRDIKHANVLVDSQGRVKLIDFGLSNFFEAGKMLETFCGSPAYAAPEMLLGHQYVGPQVDIWSLGVLLYSMLAKKLPFPNVKELLAGVYEKVHEISDCLDLIEGMLAPAEQRMDIDAVMNHPWLQ